MKSQSPVHLQFSREGKFRILAIGDSHIVKILDTEAAGGPAAAAKSRKLPSPLAVEIK